MKKPSARQNNIVIKKLKKETLIYDLDTNKAVCLNVTSAMVFELCNGKRTISEIADEMSKLMKSLISTELVQLAIEQLNHDVLMKTVSSENSLLNHLSRRELVRKVGFGATVALPLVSSVVAPESIAAQSCLLAGNSSVVCFHSGIGCVPNPSPSSGLFPTFLCPEPLCCSGTCEASSTFDDTCV